MNNSSIFGASLGPLEPRTLLAYFQTRAHVRFFPVIDEEQAGEEQIAGVLCNRFCFNGESHALPAHFDWTHNPSRDREWLILLHKFYYAVGLGRAYHLTQERRYLDKWIELTSSWMDTVPLNFLTSDVMGRRVQNWVFAYYYFVNQHRVNPSDAPLPPEFHLNFLTSLHDQVAHLCEHLTPARNHRTIELYAIFLTAVVFPEMRAAAQWLDFSREQLLENMRADLLSDGVHCELSTDYHHLVLRNYLNIMKLARLNHVEMPAEMHTLLQKALEFAKYVHKPDGAVPSLSDGDVRSFGELLRQGYELTGDEELLYVATHGRKGRPPALRSRLFPASGYAILRSGWGDGSQPFDDEHYLVFDCGSLGAGNHGHLDLLSFEMAAYGRSLIVDPGRYTYYEPPPDSGEINWRARFRGTGYHNTVMVDGKEQTQYTYHKTRFKIRGPAPDHRLSAELNNGVYDFLHGVACSHEYPVVHERKILFARPTYWIMTDILRPHDPAEMHTYDLCFHLAAEANGKVRVTQTVTPEHNAFQMSAPYLEMLHLAPPAPAQVEAAVTDGYISHSYGSKHPAPVLHFLVQGSTVVLHTILYPYSGERPHIHARLLPVSVEGRDQAPIEAFALWIDIRHRDQHHSDLYFAANPDVRRTFSFGDHTSDKPLFFLRC